MTRSARPAAHTARTAFGAALIFTTALLAACSQPPPAAPTDLARGDQAAVAQHLEALITHGMKARQVAGLSIAVVHDQTVLWSRGFGWADADQRTPATAETVYRMGSISKLFTTTAALQLAQQGRLDLDAPIQKALPGFHPGALPGQPAITPRLLMSHHAGLMRDRVQGMWGSEVGGFKDVVMGLGTEAQAYPPGLVFSYSNLGMTVLGAAVEQIAQTPFASHLQNALLQPLGMTSAVFTPGLPTGSGQAHEAGKVVNELALRDTPAGGLSASVQDMSRFMMMVFANGKTLDAQQLLEPALLQDMLRAQNAGNALELDVRTGLGWMLNPKGPEGLRNAGGVVHHNGATQHFRAHMGLLPTHKLGVIVAANSASASPLVDLVVKRTLSLELEVLKGIRQPTRQEKLEPGAVPWSEAQLHSWAGDYATAAGHARVVRQGKSLSAQVSGETLQLLPGTEGGAVVRYKRLGLLSLPVEALEEVAFFRRTVQGRELLVARSGGQEMRVGERLPAQDNTRATRWLGTYKPVPASTDIPSIDRVTLYLDRGVLLARMKMAQAEGGTAEVVPIRLASDHEARLLRPLADFGERVRLFDVQGQPAFESSGLVFLRSTP